MAISDPDLLLSILTEQRTSVTAGEPRETGWSLSNRQLLWNVIRISIFRCPAFCFLFTFFFKLIIISVFIYFASSFLLCFFLRILFCYSLSILITNFFLLSDFWFFYYVFLVLVCCSLFLFYFVFLRLYSLILPLLSFLSILGAFAKFRKATITLVMSVCLSAYPAASTTLLALDGLSLNLTF
jgi:hypothetical protein